MAERVIETTIAGRIEPRLLFTTFAAAVLKGEGSSRAYYIKVHRIVGFPAFYPGRPMTVPNAMAFKYEVVFTGYSS